MDLSVLFFYKHKILPFLAEKIYSGKIATNKSRLQEEFSGNLEILCIFRSLLVLSLPIEKSNKSEGWH